MSNPFNLEKICSLFSLNGEFIEYKRSFSQKEYYKCYYIRNYYVLDVSIKGTINLMDPENLKGLGYLKKDY